MYEQHFGFKRRPFRAVATGADVFVGPQTAKIMQATKLAIATPDAVIAVMGPPGTGKTTIVNRALDSIDGDKLVIRIARMQLGHDEVLDFLLDELQAQNVPASTIRKVTLFRRLLAERTSAGVRVIIVVEDAIRIGDDALAEIEALTSADGVGNEGAALVIMGEPDLRDRLDGDALTRLKQRIRAYQFVNPLVAPELQGYLKHCFRLGGGEFDLVFDAQGAQFLHALTGGVPRTANSVVEAVLNAAAGRKLPRVDNRFVAAVAESEFGLSAPLPEPVTPAAPQAATPAATARPAADAKPEAAVAAADAKPEAAVAATAAPEASQPARVTPAVEIPQPAAEPAPAPREEETSDDAAATATASDDDIPQLIQDTLPDLEVLAPELTSDADEEAASSESEPEPAVPAAGEDEPTDVDLIPTLASTGQELALDAAPELQPEPLAEADETPEPMLEMVADAQQDAPAAEPETLRDPTMAELKPDFDILEEAMAGLADDDEAAPEAEQAVPEQEETRDPTLPSLPTITLDAAIQENIAQATAALEKHDATIADDTVSEETSDIAAAAPKKPDADAMSDTDIKKIASGIRKARSLEDVDEKMAETLFGAEFSAIAAQVIANPPPPSDTSSQPQLDEAAVTGGPEVPDEDQLIQELSLVEDSLASNPKDKAAGDNEAPQLDKPTTEMEKEFLDVYGKDALEVSLESDKPNPGMDLSASQRLATVRALNAEQVPKAALPPKPAQKAESGTASPQPIEEQISTSMTATLKALSARPDSANDEDDDEEETPKRGFFSRFRRS